MKRVYIVDDDRNIVESLSIVLKNSGFDVSSQYDENGVVENISEYQPDLVVLDVMFPENDGAGFDMARAIKGDKRIGHIPILMLSAINEKGEYAGTFSNRDRDSSWLPVEDFVEKPIDPVALINKVRTMLGM
ncbi:MAG: response regulator [Bdellovibrionales bacterium]|jgi:CheY-like chemotaxis protein|nr:response regulator [Bdellovibrionales bacterium]MBT3526681.1 response regulator [Bdellovibrionales bacterium]MBT7667978.1 response regulator [Bdellovibrionales bacterium]MBT7765606.1 response regulator [Bdellovibrionales bacterium]